MSFPLQLVGIDLLSNESAIKVMMLKTSPSCYSFSSGGEISVICQLAVLANFAPPLWGQLLRLLYLTVIRASLGAFEASFGPFERLLGAINNFAPSDFKIIQENLSTDIIQILWK